jgi:hypothetical protein
MATELVKVKLADGKELLVEVEEPTLVGVQATALGPGGEIDLASAMEHVKGAATQLFQALQEMTVKPDDCEITFGIKLSASAGVILAKAGAEANFEVKLGWSSKPAR